MDVLGTLGEAFVILRADGTQLDKDIDAKAKHIEQRLGEIGAKTQRVGQAMTVGLTLPIVGVGVAATRSFLDFEGAMKKVEAALLPTKAELQQLEKAALEWGSKTKFSAAESADALGELGKAGFTTSQSIAALPAVLQMATISGMSLADTATLTADTLTQYGLAVTEAGRVNDVLTLAAQRSTVDVAQLGESLKYAGPVAAAFGMDIEATSAALAEFGNAGIKADMAGTSLRNILTDIENPTKGMKDTLKELGIETLKSADGTIKLADVIDKLREKGATAGQVMMAFGDRAGPGMVALVSKGSDGLRKLEADLDKAAGTADKAAATIMQGLGGALEEMRGSLETAGVAVGKVLEPAVRTAATTIGALADFTTNNLVPAFQGLATPVQVVIGGLVGVVAAAGPMIMIAGSIISNWALVAQTFGTVSTMASGLATSMPLLASATLLAAKAAAVAAVAWASWEIGKKLGEVTGATDWIGKKLAGALYGVSEAQYKATAAAVKNAEANKGQTGAIAETDKAAAKLQQELAKLTGGLGQNAGAAGNAGKKTKELSEAQKKAQADAKAYADEMERLTRQFGGAEASAQADKYIEILRRIGGATKLTRQETEQMGAVMLSALGKAVAMGDTAGIQKYGQQYAQLQPGPKLDMRPTLLYEQAQTSINDQIRNRPLFTTPVEMPVAVKPTPIQAEKTSWVSKMFGGSEKDGGAKLGQALGNSIMGAVQGGGSVSKSIGATLGQQVGNVAGEAVGGLVAKGIGKAVGATAGKVIGGVVGSVIPVFGTMIGAAIGGWIGGKIGKGKREAAETNAMRDDLLKQAGGLDKLKDSAEKAGVSVDKLMSTKKPKEFTAEVEKLNKALDETKKRQEGLATAASGTSMIAKGLASQLGKITEFGAEQEGSLNRLSTLTMQTFGAMVKETGDVTGAILANKDALELLTSASEQFGFTGGEATQKLMGMFSVVRDNEDAFAIITGVGNVMKGMNQGMAMNAEVAQAFGSELAAQFKVIKDRGGDATVALALMQPQLQQLWEHQKKFKDQTDEATLSMLAQAEEQGLVGDKMRDVNERILDVLVAIGDALGAQLPSDVERFQQSLDNVKVPTWKVGVEFEAGAMPGGPGGGDYTGDLPQLADGGVANWGTGTLAVLHNKEAVIPLDRLESMLEAGNGGGASADVVRMMQDMQRPNVTVAPTFNGTLANEMQSFLREQLIPMTIQALRDSGALRDEFFNLQRGTTE